MRSSLALLIVLLASLSACAVLDESDRPAEDLQLRTDRSSYAVGDVIKVTVTNPTSQTLFLANCCGPIILGVEQWQDDAWSLYRPGVCELLCLSVPLEIRPKETRTDPSLTLDAPGRYRLTLNYGYSQVWEGDILQVISHAISVE